MRKRRNTSLAGRALYLIRAKTRNAHHGRICFNSNNGRRAELATPVLALNRLLVKINAMPPAAVSVLQSIEVHMYKFKLAKKKKEETTNSQVCVKELQIVQQLKLVTKSHDACSCTRGATTRQTITCYSTPGHHFT